MKKFYTIILLTVFVLSAWAANIPAGTKLYLTPNSNWKQNNERFAAYFYGNGEAWVSATAVVGETDLYEVTTPAPGDFTNVIFCRMNGSTTINNWGNKWDQTGDLTYNGTNNRFTITGTSNNYAGTWSLYTPLPAEEPSLLLSAPTSVFIDGAITITPTPTLVTDPIYTYSVKVPDGDFTSTTMPYQPTVAGVHSFSVTVAESSTPSAILATETIEVEVNALPEPIVIKVKIPADWTNTISFFCWGGPEGFQIPTVEDDWYQYTFTHYIEKVNFLIVNGTGFTGGDDNQTENLENITASGCYQIGNATGTKRTTTPIDCSTTTSDIQQSSVDISIFVENTTIQASFKGSAKIELYSITGALLHSAVAKNNFNYSVEKGIYLLRINGKAHKVLVK